MCIPKLMGFGIACWYSKLSVWAASASNIPRRIWNLVPLKADQIYGVLELLYLEHFLPLLGDEYNNFGRELHSRSLAKPFESRSGRKECGVDIRCRGTCPLPGVTYQPTVLSKACLLVRSPSFGNIYNIFITQSFSRQSCASPFDMKAQSGIVRRFDLSAGILPKGLADVP